MRIAKALLFDGRGNALVLQRSGTHPYFAHEADLPGGIIEHGESFEEGLVREIFEEAGITIAADQLTYATSRDKFGSTKHLYTVILDDQPEVTLSWEHGGYEWVEPSNLLERLESKDDYMAIVQEYIKQEL